MVKSYGSARPGRCQHSLQVACLSGLGGDKRLQGAPPDRVSCLVTLYKLEQSLCSGGRHAHQIANHDISYKRS